MTSKPVPPLTSHKSTLLGSASAPGIQAKKWDFVDKATGETLGPASVASFAQVMVEDAKRRVAEEQRRGRWGLDRKGQADPDARKAHAEMLAWLRGPLQLEKVHHSIAHRIIPSDLPVEAHVLLVNHNWGALLSNATISGPSGGQEAPTYRLPYPITVFEFFFTGGVHAVCVAMQNREDISCSTHFRMPSKVWFKAETEVVYDHHGVLQNSGQLEGSPLVKAYDLITQNIFAITVMLEAEVAVATSVREAYKRNRERPIRKELPGMSHHIVVLAKRARTQRSDYPGEDRRSPRLHFRRGHWRHFSSHRTWIKWQLVGNPDLGFIEKEYSL
jgi:hypothetical protein